jgi:hypothetical protein
MTNRYIISGSTPGYKTPYYLLLISESDAARLKVLASSIEFPKCKDLEAEYVLFRSDQIPISVIVFTDPTSWREEMRSLLGDTITDAIEASMDDDTNDAYTVLDLDELSEEDRTKFKEALGDYARFKYDYWFYLNSNGGVGVFYADDCPEEPFYTFLHVTTVRRQNTRG